MKYLVVQDWPSTHGNHAGMVHMCNLLVQTYPNEYRVIVRSCPYRFSQKCSFINRQINKILKLIYEKWIFPYSYIVTCKPYLKQIKENDEVFLLEYLFPETSQLELAKYIRNKNKNTRIYALSHLTPEYAESKYTNYKKMISIWSKPIDKYLTLGSSLSSYLHNNGIETSKISTGFHYVDNIYYSKSTTLDNNDRIRIIVIGAMARNFNLLSEIVQKTHDVDWIICKGRSNVDDYFKDYNNVTLLGYMTENELHYQMSISDISVSVMNDTIGSNVITTSLSMGLALIVSDVGSIRDYCTNADTIFCDNTTESFINAINCLNQDREKLKSMKKAAKLRAKLFSIKHVHEWFNTLKTKNEK